MSERSKDGGKICQRAPTAELADYVLPAASWLERPLCTLSVPNIMDWVKGGVRAIEPLGERHTDYDFFKELGIRLGQAQYWPWKTAEEVIEHRLKPVGITYKEPCPNAGHR